MDTQQGCKLFVHYMQKPAMTKKVQKLTKCNQINLLGQLNNNTQATPHESERFFSIISQNQVCSSSNPIQSVFL